jgi:pimeloyl-ACP methyl ester carboxylesterase
MNTILYSKIIGSGAPLCILHGFLGMSDNWKTLGNAYAEQGFEVHLIDQRNHGRSFHSENFNYDLMAEDLMRYLEHHGITKTNIIGHSMGGKTAMKFACEQASFIDKLIIADIAPKYYPPHHQDIINALLKMDLAKVDSRTAADEQLQKHLNNKSIRQFLLKNLYWNKEKQLAFRFNLKVLAHKMNEVGENISGTDTFPGPTLFLRGSRSEYILPSDFETISRHFPQAKVETIERAGHWLHAEKPKEFLEKSLVFLQG